MSLSYCDKCLVRTDLCECKNGPHEPFIYGSVRVAVEEEKREINKTKPISYFSLPASEKRKIITKAAKNMAKIMKMVGKAFGNADKPKYVKLTKKDIKGKYDLTEEALIRLTKELKDKLES